MIRSAPVAIEEVSASSAPRMTTPKSKVALSRNKTLSSTFDPTLPIFPEMAAAASGSAKYCPTPKNNTTFVLAVLAVFASFFNVCARYEVFMAAAGGGRVREIKVSFAFHSFFEVISCCVCVI